MDSKYTFYKYSNVNIGPSRFDKIVDWGILPENDFGGGCQDSIALDY